MKPSPLLHPQVWPKIFDLLNLALYTSMAAVAHTHPAFARVWTGLITSGVTAAYFVGSLLARRPFCLELAKESADPAMWGVPAFWRLNFNISLAWAAAMCVVTLSGLVRRGAGAGGGSGSGWGGAGPGRSPGRRARFGGDWTRRARRGPRALSKEAPAPACPLTAPSGDHTPTPLPQAYRLIVILSGPNGAADIALNLVLGIAPLVAAVAAQHTLITRFAARVRRTVARLLAERGAAAGGGRGGDAAPAKAAGPETGEEAV
jgi:hypothetical protein